MPTYEYSCKGCGEHLEVVQSFRDDPLTDCPNCGGDLRKVFGAIGISFKGRGFYRTDSRDTRHRKEAGTVEKKEPASDKKDAASGSGSGSGSGDGGSSTGGSGTTKSESSPAPKAAASS